MSPPSLVLGYRYPALWGGGLFLCFFGATCFLALLPLLSNPAVPGPNQPSLLLLVTVFGIFGSVVLALGLFLIRLALRLSERFEVRDLGVAWYKSGKFQAFLPWKEIEHIQFEPNSSVLTLEGPPGTPVFEISNSFAKFDRFMRVLQTHINWEELVRTPSRRIEAIEKSAPGSDLHGDSASPSVFAKNAGETGAKLPKEYELIPLPAVHRTRLAFAASVVGTAVLLMVTVFFWIVDAPQKPVPNIGGQNIDRAAVRAQEKDIAKFNFLKYFILPLLCVLTGSSIFTSRTEFRVDEDGIEVRYFLRSSHYSWRELRTAKVVIAKVVVNHVARYHHSLAVVLRHGKPITVALGDESYRWRDTIFVAARSAGRSIELDEQDA